MWGGGPGFLITGRKERDRKWGVAQGGQDIPRAWDLREKPKWFYRDKKGNDFCGNGKKWAGRVEENSRNRGEGRESLGKKVG